MIIVMHPSARIHMYIWIIHVYTSTSTLGTVLYALRNGTHTHTHTHTIPHHTTPHHTPPHTHTLINIYGV